MDEHDRIQRAFATIEAEKRTGLVLFLTVGFPDVEATLELVPALVKAGADAIELGIPFSDPLAEGPVIQESSFRALQKGIQLQDCLDVVAKLRNQVPHTPLILMGYYNPILRMGLGNFAEKAQSSGVDGLIIVDLPYEEIDRLDQECRPRCIPIIPLLAPTSTEESIKASTESASGFVYCISVTGVTGARQSVSQQGLDLIDRVRSHTSLPVALGFGVSTRDHVEAVGSQAQAAVVGSALIRVMLESPRDQLVERATRFVEQLSGY